MNKVTKHVCGLVCLLSVIILFACKDSDHNNTVPPDVPDVVDNQESTRKFYLTLTKSVSVPISNPAALAVDVDHFWIISQCNTTVKLIKYDPTDFTILKEFNYQNLIKELGTNIGGIAWDGNSVWVSIWGRTNQIFQIDGENGEIKSNFSIPGYNPSDLDWDGEFLWLSIASDAIYKIDPADTEQIFFVDIFSEERNLQFGCGIAVDENYVWLDAFYENSITIFDKETGEKIETIEDTLIEEGHLAFYNEQLLVLSEKGIDIYTIEQRPAHLNLTLTKSIPLPVSNPVGLSIDGDHFWIMSGQYNSMASKLIKYDPVNGKILKEFDHENLIEQLGTGIGGIAWDGNSVWVSIFGQNNTLIEIDGENGEIKGTFSIPAFAFGPTDLDWDGEFIWLSTGNGLVYKLDPTDMSQIKFFELPYPERDYGIAVNDNYICLGNLFEHSITIINKISGEKIFTLEDVLAKKGTLAFYDEQLLVLSEEGIDFYSLELRFLFRLFE